MKTHLGLIGPLMLGLVMTIIGVSGDLAMPQLVSGKNNNNNTSNNNNSNNNNNGNNVNQVNANNTFNGTNTNGVGVPEPTSLILVGAGLAGFWIGRKILPKD
jgi:PEP-CTERM motif-containing protein